MTSAADSGEAFAFDDRPIVERELVIAIEDAETHLQNALGVLGKARNARPPSPPEGMETTEELLERDRILAENIQHITMSMQDMYVLRVAFPRHVRDYDRLAAELATWKAACKAHEAGSLDVGQELVVLRAELATAKRERDEAIDAPIARLQFPDGSAPGNTEEAAKGWKYWYEVKRDEACRLHDEITPAQADNMDG